MHRKSLRPKRRLALPLRRSIVAVETWTTTIRFSALVHELPKSEGRGSTLAHAGGRVSIDVPHQMWRLQAIRESVRLLLSSQMKPLPSRQAVGGSTKGIDVYSYRGG